MNNSMFYNITHKKVVQNHNKRGDWINQKSNTSTDFLQIDKKNFIS